MNTYTLNLLNIDEAITGVDKMLKDAERLNASKVVAVISARVLKEAKRSREHNIHRFLAGNSCSCGLTVPSIDGEKNAVAQERIFRARGHVNWVKGELTKLFVRTWPAINMDGSFSCWWCVECGYLSAAEFDKNGAAVGRPLHECRSELYRRELLRNLRRSYVRIGHAHWNHATKSFADQVEHTLDAENEFIEFRQDEQLVHEDEPSWFVYCTVCDKEVSGHRELPRGGWLYEYRERHREEHIKDRQITWHELKRD